ncbi:MAG TPA: zf-HC2 domain-containing protein, partial [Polyangia bacterium]
MTGSTTGAPTGTTTAAACSNLHPFIDGELDEADAAAFRQHLGVCATCPGELEAAVLADAVAEAGLGVQLGAAARVTDAAAPAPAHAVATAATNGGAATT